MEDVGGWAVSDWVCGRPGLGPPRTPPHPVVAAVVEGREALIVVVGSVDRFSWPRLEAVLLDVVAEGARSLLLDASLLSFVDATAVTRLAAIGRRLLSEGGGLRVASPPPVLRRLVDLLLVADALAVDATSRRECPPAGDG